ncbi:DUF998 domain-containing protein [Micromonospora radicis]|uniref:DUF998 domain-containing protein n=1 Tax=Micromonospora radicis TaxID=1894971 RepID=A0A418MX43_9ACTN|nr:DUF998 domain-containing protein [Micromonospora radicis]RIV39443.1 DUF998 domain-containing protein [Micromonospora radicis]
MPGTRNIGVLALGGIALAALLAVVGHLGVDDLDPVSLTVSDYAVSDSGGAIHVAMVTLAVASALLVPALPRLGPPGGRRGGTHHHTGVDPAGGRDLRRPRAAELLLAAWAGGLLLAGLVPTNPPGTEMGTAAYLHRYASVVAFLALPVAGWLLAARLPAESGARRWLRVLTVASLVLAAAQVWSAYPGDRAFYGLIERALILTEVALLVLVASTLLRRPDPSMAAWWRPPGTTPVRAASADGRPR